MMRQGLFLPRMALKAIPAGGETARFIPANDRSAAARAYVARLEKVARKAKHA